MEKSYSESYAAAGVDITAGYRSVELMKQYVARPDRQCSARSWCGPHTASSVQQSDNRR